MVRATVRYSLPSTWKAERGDIREALAKAGFDHAARATWEASGLPLADVLGALRDVLTIVEQGGAVNSLSIELVDDLDSS